MLLPLSLLPVAFLLLPPAVPPGPAASITSVVNGATTYSASQPVHIWRGEPAQLEVFGAVVGTALGVDVLLTDGRTPAPLMVGTITTRKPSSVVIRLDVAAPVTRATYIVRMRYAAAAGAPDQFIVRVYDRGSITSLSASNATPKVGETITITATGQNLEKAKLDLSQVGQSPSSYSVTSRSATALSFTIKFGGVGLTSIGSHQFLDEDIGSSLGLLAGQYTGNSAKSLEVMPNPVITTVTPAATVGSGTVTISGSGLNPSGWTPKIRIDDGSSTNPELSATVVNGATVQFQSGMTSNYRDLYLRYRRSDGSSGLTEIPLPQQVLAQLTPIIARAGSVISGAGPGDCAIYPPCPSGADTRVFGLKVGTSHELQGMWLQPAPNTPVVVKHGSTTMNVTYTSHNLLRFTVPPSAPAMTGPLTVQTGGGTATSPRTAFFAPPASGLSLQKKDGPETGNYPYVPVTDGRLEPDRNYRVVGTNLHVIPYGSNEGAAMPVVAPVVSGSMGGAYSTNIGDGWTSFHLPPGQPLGSVTLTYRHWGGLTTIGTFQVVAPMAVVSAMEVKRGSTTWFSNVSVQGSTTDRTIQSGSSTSLSVKVTPISSGALPPLTVTSSDPVVHVGGPYTFSPSSVVYDPNDVTPTTATVSVTLQVQPVAAARNVSLTFKAGNNAGAIAVVPVTLAPVPLPALESVAFEPGELTGGEYAKARVILAATPPVAMSLPVSTKATGVQIPASVTLSAKETVLQVPTPVVTVPTTVMVSVGTGTDARNASLVLHPVIRVQSLVPKASPIPSGSVTDGVLTLDAPAWESITVTLASSNSALLTVPSSVTFRKGQSVASIPLTAAAGVPTVISVNVDAKLGQQTHTATIRVGPATQ